MMDDADGEIADGPRPQLCWIVARLLRAHKLRDRLVREIAGAEQETGAVPADLLAALSDAEHALLALEAEVLDAACAVIVADRQICAARQENDEA